MTTSNLHIDDCPLTLALLAALLPRESRGIEWEDNGATVDWHVLECGVLSSSERATATVARGLCMMERSGSRFPGDGSVARAVLDLVRSMR